MTEAPTGTIDLTRPFTFVADDARWLQKILVGGVVNFLMLVLIGIPLIFGYLARLARNVARGEATPLPEWDQWGRDFGEGLSLAVIGLIYYFPVVVLFLFTIGGSAMVGAMTDAAFEEGSPLAGGLFGIGACFGYLLALIVSVILPAALTRAVMLERFGAAFELGAIFRYISANLGNYVISILIHLVASFIANFGVALLCVGAFFTGFWAFTVTTFAFAETWRFSRVK